MVEGKIFRKFIFVSRKVYESHDIGCRS